MARIRKIQFYRGLKANLPTLNEGEPGFCTDTGELYVGTTSGNIKVNGGDSANKPNLYTGVCPTAAGTAAKIVTIDGVNIATGDVVIVTYTGGNTANSPTLNLNGGGAKQIRLGGQQPTGASGTGAAYCAANGVVMYFYDGTYFNQVGSNDITDADTTYSAMTQTEADTGTATTARTITAKVLNDSVAAKAGTAINGHITNLISTEQGVHGIRYWDGKLQVLNGSDWEDADEGGGGIPTGDCTNIAVTVGNAQLKISWKDPDDTVVSGTTLAQWAATKLVRKVGGYPTSPTDGTLVLTNTVRNQYQNGYTDSGLTNGTLYYYKLFPISATNAVNTNTTNQISGTPQPFKTFGVSIDLANSNPSTAVTYTDDAVGMTAASSSWDSQAIFKDIKPCVLKNGVVQYYLNPSDFTKKADGTAADITSGNAGDVMIEFPKVGVAIATSGNTLTIKVTDDPNKSGFHYYAHTRVNEGDKSNMYMGAYKGQIVSSKLRSISGVAPTVSQTIGAFRTAAQANGSGYDQMSFYALTLIQALFVIRFKNLDSQTALGQGYTGGTALVNTGGTNTNGMFYGSTSTTSRVKCFGIEDLWGNIYNWIDGLFCDASRNILTAFQNFNDTGANYVSRGQGATANIGNYMSKPQGTTETGFIAKEVSGSSSTYFADDAALSTGFLPSFGGHWGNGANAGVFMLLVNSSASNVSASFGGRLMYL